MEPTCLRESELDALLLAAPGGAPGATLEQRLAARVAGEGALAADRVTHALACAACRARVEDAFAVRARFLAGPFARTLPAVAAALEREPVRRGGLLAWLRMPRFVGAGGLVLAGAVAVALFAPRSLVVPAAVETRPGEAPTAGVRTKGGAAVRVLAVRGGGSAFEPSAANPARPGDALRVVALSDGWTHVAILGLDAGGAPMPALSHEATAMPLPSTGPLAGSYVLDDAPGPERLLAVFASAPLGSDEVLRLARANPAGGHDPAGRWEVLLVGVPKETTP